MLLALNICLPLAWLIRLVLIPCRKAEMGLACFESKELIEEIMYNRCAICAVG